MGPEAKIETASCDYARRLGCYTRKFKSTSQRGVPDRLFISNTGKVFFIEFKALGKSPTALQLRELALINSSMGELINSKMGSAHWADSLESAKEIIDSHCK